VVAFTGVPLFGASNSSPVDMRTIGREVSLCDIAWVSSNVELTRTAKNATT
jgi:hypothetical protein